MRRGLTLIELIFSMVIIAFAFTIFPKILQISAKTSNTTLKEEAMYNAAALMGFVKNLPWDEQNTKEDDILLVDGGLSELECEYSFGGEPIYRQGGFVGSRNCAHRLHASSIGGNGESEADDIDDLSGRVIKASNLYGNREYNLSIQVGYTQDFTATPATTSTNTKYIKITATPARKELSGAFSPFWYLSYNIGQIRVNRLSWRQP